MNRTSLKLMGALRCYIRPGTLFLMACVLVLPVAMAVIPDPNEIALSRQWAESSFGPGNPTDRSRLVILREDVPDGVSIGRSWRGTPFQIGEKTYSHGLAFNANKHLRIILDRPAARFVSDIGLENNDDTQRGAEAGHGSVTFHVRTRDQEVLTSPLMKLKDAPRSISIPLDGAREFEIRVDDGGDGRGWDQALWGGAEIEMQDGIRLRLQDLASTLSADENPSQFSFVFGGKPSAELLPHWKREVAQSRLDGIGDSQKVVYLDPDSKMEVRLEATCFQDFPAVEWVVRFKNNGDEDSPLLENIQAMDSVFRLSGPGGTILHWAKGGVASFDDFAPQIAELKPGARLALTPKDGRSSSEILPFFNLEGSGSGVVLAIGWSGRWAAKFEAKNPGAVRVNAGMATTRLVLRPGEEIRTPRILALRYEGNRWRGQNLLRQFILAHHRPKKNGQPLQAPITCGNWGSTPAAVHLDNIHKFIQHRLPIDYYWIDAGWYGKPILEKTEQWASSVGDWRVKTNLYPEGFKPLSTLLRQDHRELMLWFEPERVFKGTPWHQEHGKWLIDLGGDNLLMNLGNSNACRFIADFIAGRIDEFGLGCYRQDFNMDPVPFWQKADAPDRQGMAEIRHIEGLYAFWDGLLARHPHLIIDNCASGGRRIDLETIGRATPFWRTDGPRDAIAHQCHSYGLLAWMPFSAISQDREGDTYEFRSSMCSSLCINWNHSGDGPTGPLPVDFPFDWARKTLEQYLRIRDFYYGDYYPLTGYSQATDQWMAYQLNRSDNRQGLVVALRRPESPYETCRFPLQGLDETASYEVTNLDTGTQTRQSGRELASQGLPVAIDSKPGSVLLVYRKL